MPPSLFEYTERNFWVYVFGGTFSLNVSVIYSGRSRPSDKGVGGGGGHSDPEIRGRGRSPKNFFWPFGP